MTKPDKTIEQRYKKLDEIDHVLKRPGRYIGSVKPHASEEFVANIDTKKMVKRFVVYNPAFLKIFDEVISNSADHSKRAEGKGLTEIRVSVNRASGEIIVHDNGGIPVVIHSEHNQYVPELIFELRAGSNFDDDDADQAFGTGQNGEGAALTAIFSKTFHVKTCDSKNVFEMEFSGNSKVRSAAKVAPVKGEKGYTTITYNTDFEKFGLTGIDDDNYSMLYTRVVEIAATNPHLKVFWQGERILMKSFKDYVEMFGDEEFDYAYDESQHYRVAVASSDDGFQHSSFVNSTNVRHGGTHILYIGMQIWEALREYIKKKHKVDVKPSELRQHIHLFIDCAIVNPRYNSQTKEELITEPKDYKTVYTPSEKFINKIIKSSIIQNILDAAEAKALIEKNKLLRAKMKDLDGADYRRVPKFIDALEKKERHKCILFLAEGDSAKAAIQGGRGLNSRYIASFPLKGKPLNVRDKELGAILGIKDKKIDKKTGKEKKAEPSVIQNILTLMGLTIGKKVNSINDLNFGMVAFCTDADVDGAHISGLLINLFEKFWPELFEMGVVNIFRTPLVKVFVKGQLHREFFTEREFFQWEQTEGLKIRGWSKKYYKGLGTHKTPEFAEYLNNLLDYLFLISMDTQEDRDAIDLAFNNLRADNRKEWLETPALNFEDFIIEN